MFPQPLVFLGQSNGFVAQAGYKPSQYPSFLKVIIVF
jgi:hypothetical protein